MKKHLLSIIFLFILIQTFGQSGYPVFQQKTINSFVYNPAFAGSYGGDFTLLYRSYPLLEGQSYSTTYMHGHAPIFQNSGGIGFKFYSDKYGITNSIYGSLGAAYHINFSGLKSLSFGLSADFSRIQINQNALNENVDISDSYLVDYNSNFSYDFSFGLKYKSKYFSIGGAVNQLNSFINLYEAPSEINSFYSFYSGLHIPVFNDRDRVEPLLSYRFLSSIENEIGSGGRYDLGVYYTYNDLLTLGGSYGNNGLMSIAMGFNYKNLYLEYNFEDIGGNNYSQKSTANSFMLVYKFKSVTNKDRFTEQRLSNRNIITSQRKSYKTVTGKIRTSKKSLNTKSLSQSSRKEFKTKNKGIKLKPSRGINSLDTVKKNKKKRNKSVRSKNKYYKYKR